MENESMESFPFKVKEDYQMASGEESNENVAENKEENVENTTDNVDEDVKAAKEEVNKDIDEVTTENVDNKVEDNKVENEASVENTDTIVEPEAKQEVEPEKIDNSSLIREEIQTITNGEYDSIEELYKANNDLLETTSATDYLGNLNEAVAEKYGEGVTFADVIEYKSRDFDNMDEMSVLEEHLEKTYDSITPEQISAHMRPFALLKKSDAEIAELIEDERITQTEVDDLKARLTRKAMDARGELKEFQDSINIDELQVSSPKIAEKVVPQESEAELNARLERYDSIIKSMPDYTFEVGDDKNPANFTLQKTDDDRNGVSEFLKGDNLNGVERNFIDRHWANEDGSVNMEKLSQDMYKVISYERDIKLAYAQGKSATSKEVKDIDNINFDKTESVGAPVTDDRSQMAAIAREANS